MDVVHERCCGLDVHKRTVVACAIVPASGAGGASGVTEPRREVRTFSTMTDDLLALADWLAGLGVTHVVLQSTGSYWRPVWNLLEAYAAHPAGGEGGGGAGDNGGGGAGFTCCWSTRST